MDYRTHGILLASIDTTDERFRISTCRDCQDLLESIAILGIIRPPLLLKTRVDGCIVVSGWRRIEACKQLGHFRMEARILPAETPAFECAKLAVAENSLQRPLNTLEQSHAFRILASHVNDPEERFRLYRLLRLPHHPSMVAKIQTVCDFPASIQALLLDGTIQLPIALALAEMPGEDAIFFAGLFSDLKIGLNKQREILLNATEIAMREDIRIGEIFHENPIRELIDAPDLDLPQKTEKIRSALRKRRFPNIAAAEEVFENSVRELPLRNSIGLTPPRHFEGMTYTMELRFNDLEEFRERAERVTEMVDHPALKKILGNKNG
ncbi:MAG: ParB/RepB/Spo0J family partition protein [Thermodesulfobacteriota bacterium]